MTFILFGGSRLDSIDARLEAMEMTMSQISDAVAALRTQVTKVQGTEASALTLIQGIVAQLQAALANAADDAAAVAAVKELTQNLSTSDDPLAAAVAANTPPATPPSPTP